MSPSPPKHRKLIAQARDKSMRPSTSGWSKLTSRKYVCCQMLQVSLSCSFLLSPSAVRHVTYNIVGLHKERLGASLPLPGSSHFSRAMYEEDPGDEVVHMHVHALSFLRQIAIVASMHESSKRITAIYTV